MTYVYAAFIGAIGGTLSGLFGIGGGIIMVPAMVYLLNLPFKVAVGTSLLVIIPTAAMGSLKHYTAGHINWQMALSLVPMAVVGGYAGAWLTTQISAGNLKRTFGCLLLVVGIRMVLGK